MRSGNSALPRPLPLTLGSDLSGIVERLGEGVPDFRVGDTVFGVTNAQFTGAYAVLIHGAAGNVGAYAVQLARRERVTVIATCGTKDVSYARTLGAYQVIDYRTTEFTSIVNRVDAVIDLVGGEIQTGSFEVIKPGGVLISVVSQPDQNLAARTETRAAFFLVDVTTTRLERIAELMRARKLLTNIGAVLPLADAGEPSNVTDHACARSPPV
ncbi:zinc-binding dehydrogenase [Lichenifustis flavocetrariae]|uniref:zinc-binding dehydrogenase n=1 Tax=Lichenifustis flavocetrariae TaxID=2949735 RepID=UPI0031F52204